MAGAGTFLQTGFQSNGLCDSDQWIQQMIASDMVSNSLSRSAVNGGDQSDESTYYFHYRRHSFALIRHHVIEFNGYIIASTSFVLRHFTTVLIRN